MLLFRLTGSEHKYWIATIAIGLYHSNQGCIIATTGFCCEISRDACFAGQIPALVLTLNTGLPPWQQDCIIATKAVS
jgi:hypothetical protein